MYCNRIIKELVININAFLVLIIVIYGENVSNTMAGYPIPRFHGGLFKKTRRP